MTELLPTLTGLFLVIALSAYVLFGGADFGGGILEVTLPTATLRSRLQKTLAPVWEANHVWLIAVVVILFVGFPVLYAEMMTRLYVPMSLALVAIVLRGTFFTLRKYDPEPGPWLPLYSALFRVSSALAPIFFGFLVSGLLATHPDPGELGELDFAAVYVRPWLDGFGCLTALFVASLFGYLAAVFFFGELDSLDDRELLARRIRTFFTATFALGGLVLLTGLTSGRVSFASAFEPATIVAQLVAAAAVLVGMRAVRRGHAVLLRIAVAAQIFGILGGWFAAQHPLLFRYRSSALTLNTAAAPPVTLGWLLVGLTLVLALVVPLLVVLYRIFSSAHRLRPPEPLPRNSEVSHE